MWDYNWINPFFWNGLWIEHQIIEDISRIPKSHFRIVFKNKIFDTIRELFFLARSDPRMWEGKSVYTVGKHNNCKHSNFYLLEYPFDDEPLTKSSRWDRKTKEKRYISKPLLIKYYNNNIGRVDKQIWLMGAKVVL